MAFNFKGCVNLLSAMFAVVAALFWLQSARAEIWSDGQTTSRRDKLVILKNGRMFDVSGTDEAQSAVERLCRRRGCCRGDIASVRRLFERLGQDRKIDWSGFLFGIDGLTSEHLFRERPMDGSKIS
jgi:hypothetical protein